MTDVVASPNALLHRAAKVLPGGASGSWRAMDAEVIERTAGQYVWTEGGRRYLDHVLAWGTIVVGHCDPRVNLAVQEMTATCDLTTVGPQRGEVELAEQVCAAMPCAEEVAFCLSGTEASLHAVQLLRARTGRRRLLKFHGSYHGWHDMLAVGVRAAPGRETQTDLRDPESARIHPGAAADVTVIEWNDLDRLQDAIAAEHGELAAVVCEPYVQSYGCVPAAPGFLETLRALCTRYRVPLVFDEVKTAFRHHLGRLPGHLWGHARSRNLQQGAWERLRDRWISWHTRADVGVRRRRRVRGGDGRHRECQPVRDGRRERDTRTAS